ncbi:MAG: gamma-glutamyl-gamma-aminobutyrate hydrolase family protein [Candidatus Cloacimonetes bacterium]|nr:gamma-glutamyl-gamma-aminobutyrate hydrolase family protein [Candidatus Cloacimonadota bacterium]
MLLIINCIICTTEQTYFGEKILPDIEAFRKHRYEITHLDNISGLKDFTKFTHLLISGSELSAAVTNKYDSELYRIIEYFLENKKSILGICYGHQMLAKTILGSYACQKAQTPEFGWRKVHIESNALFKGISMPIFAHSHFDEVVNLNEDFSVIASTENCPCQAFQYKNLPVWGIQFHPEMTFKHGSRMFEKNLHDYQSVRDNYLDELGNPEDLFQNQQIFENFINYK